MFAMKITQAFLAVVLLAFIVGVLGEEKSPASGADLVASAPKAVADAGSSGTLHGAQPRGFSSSSSSSGGYGKKHKKYGKKKYRPHSSSSGRYGGSSSSSSHFPKKYKKKHHSSSSSSGK